MIQSVKKETIKITGEFTGYKVITIDGEILHVPKDEGNRHYQEILKWVAEGNTIEEAD
jgi:hypothetical protein